MNIELKETLNWPNRYGMALFVDGEGKMAVKVDTKRIMKVDKYTRMQCAQLLSKWAHDNGYTVSLKAMLKAVEHPD